MNRSLAHIFRLHGEEMRFEEWVATQTVTQKLKGVEPDPIPSGRPVMARAMLVGAAESRERGVVAGTQVLLVEGQKFPKDLTSAWRVTLPGEPTSRQLSDPVAAQRTRRGGPASYFKARLMTGGESVGGA